MKKTFVFFAVLLFMAAIFAAGRARAADSADYNSGMGPMMGGNGGACRSCMTGGMMRGMRGGMMMRGGGMYRWGMHGEIEQGMMMGGLSDMEITPMLKEKFMNAVMRNMIKNALQDPEIKGFLDSTAPLRKNLVMKEFEYFEAFRNPATTTDELEKLKAGIRDLKMKIRAKMASHRKPAWK